ncbi:MAG: S-layer homology domain-containing protein, partial [Oscillospiraceae bacterium]|nr:S-layer homology domain-containing protein [Oscillospiraceae bacterium]
MRNLKKFLALVLAFMMTMSLMVTVNASNIDKLEGGDEVTPEFAEAVNVLLGMGIIKGSDDGGTPDIQPKRSITRAEVATMLYRLYSGDVNDSQSHLYKGYCGQFSDVPDEHWASGYIGYCATRNLVRGGDGLFQPNENITGHQALTMVLRAMGYDQLGEYTGNPEWLQNAALDGQRYGLLTNVNNSSYGGNLSQYATRELVCEIMFQAATHPMVDKDLTLGNRYVEMNSVTGVRGETLGEWNFGLTGKVGIIVGNQSTGEVATKIGFPITFKQQDTDGDGSITGTDLLDVTVGNATGITATAATLDPAYFYASDMTAATHVTLSFLDNKATPDTTKLETAKTGLEQFNHKVTVWYDRDGTDGTAEKVNDGTCDGLVPTNLTTYAIIDKANPNMVVVDDSNSNAGGADIGSYNTNVAVNNLGEILAGKGYNVPSTTGTNALYNYAFAPMQSTGNYGNNNDSWATITNSKASPVKRNDGDKLNTRDDHQLYLIISNTTDRVTGKPNVDVVISLEMTITNIIEDNAYQSPLSFGVSNSNKSATTSTGNTHFGTTAGGLVDSDNKHDIVKYDDSNYKSYLNIARDHLLGGTDPNTVHEEDKVAVLAIAGTNGRLPGDTPIPSYSFATYALGNAPKLPTYVAARDKYDLSANQFYYQITKLGKPVTGTVKYIRPDGTVELDLGDGGSWVPYPKSVFAEATDATFAGTRERGVHDMRNNETYDFYLDSEGNWLFYERTKEPTDVFVYTTYMDWDTSFVSGRFK